MFAILTVRYKYADRLFNRVGISWIDNESAKYACIKGTSDSFSMQVLARIMQQLENESPSAMWYERVASHSNPADMPSRSKLTEACRILHAVAGPLWESPSTLVDAIVQLHDRPLGVVHKLLQGR